MDLQLEHLCTFCGDEIENPDEEVVIGGVEHYHDDCARKFYPHKESA